MEESQCTLITAAKSGRNTHLNLFNPVLSIWLKPCLYFYYGKKGAIALPSIISLGDSNKN